MLRRLDRRLYVRVPRHRRVERRAVTHIFEPDRVQLILAGVRSLPTPSHLRHKNMLRHSWFLALLLTDR